MDTHALEVDGLKRESLKLNKFDVVISWGWQQIGRK